MIIKNTKWLSFLVAFLVASFIALDAFAEKTISIRMGDSRCEQLSMSGKPDRGGYNVQLVWTQRSNIVDYSLDEDKGLICFEPKSIGSTKVKVRGRRYKLNRYGKQESSETFYRAFNVRVRPQSSS
jgi:hypothetical protein